MNTTQRARLYTLTAQATRTAAEVAELTTLQALAALHPNPANDTAAPAAAAAVAAVVAAPAAVTPGLLTTAIAGVVANIRGRAAVGADLAAARASVTQLTTERDQARTALATAESARAAAQTQLGAFCSFFGLKPESLAGQTAEQIAATITTAISAAATTQLATMGVPAGALPAPQASGSGENTPGDLFAEYAALAAKDPAAAAKFYAEQIMPAMAKASAGVN